MIFFIAGCSYYQEPALEDNEDKNGSSLLNKEESQDHGSRAYDRFVISSLSSGEIPLPGDITEDEYYIRDYRNRMYSRPAYEMHVKTINSVGTPEPSKGNRLSQGFRPVKPAAHSGDVKLFGLSFDNDIFFNTDYYYTNGIKIELTHPYLGSLPTATILLPGGRDAVDYYRVSLIQNIYTPVDPDQREIQYGDRPFAAYLYVGFSKIANNPVRQFRLTSELDLGVMGPAALGGFVQKAIHEIEPTGWKNQVSNSIILNYNIQFEKGLVATRSFQLNFDGGLQAGTLYDNIYAGFILQFGKFDPYFNNITLTTDRSSKSRIRYTFFVKLQNKLIAYDATLQGGMFANNNEYTIHSADINRLVANASTGISLSIGRFGLSLEQFYLMSEFKGGKRFMYGRIKTEIRF